MNETPLLPQGAAPAPQIVGTVSPDERDLLKLAGTPAGEGQQERVAEIIQRLGGLAAEGEAPKFAVVFGDNKEGKPVTPKFVNLNLGDLGTSVQEKNHGLHGLPSSAEEALNALHEEPESPEEPKQSESLKLSEEERHAIFGVGDKIGFAGDVKMAGRERLSNLDPSYQRQTDESIMSMGGQFAEKALERGQRGSAALAAAITAGAVRNPDFVRQVLDKRLDVTNVLGVEGMEAMASITDTARQIRERPDLPEDHKVHELHNAISAKLNALPEGSDTLRAVLTAYGAGATMEMPSASDAYMSQLSAMI